MSSEVVKAMRRARSGKAGIPPKPATGLDPVAVSKACPNFGNLTDETVTCPTCGGGKVELKVYNCAAFGTCTIGKPVEGRGCCSASCPGLSKQT